MDKFFREYVDLTAMIIMFSLPLLITVIIKRKLRRQIRAVACYFLFFAPLSIAILMFFHLFENTYRAIEIAMTNRFTYDFHFYSRMLMGTVLAGIAILFTRACWQKSMGRLPGNRIIYLCMGLVAVICLPLIPITPLSYVPVFCCVISLPGVFFVRRGVKQMDRRVLSNITTEVAA